MRRDQNKLGSPVWHGKTVTGNRICKMSERMADLTGMICSEIIILIPESRSAPGGVDEA